MKTKEEIIREELRKEAVQRCKQYIQGLITLQELFKFLGILSIDDEILFLKEIMKNFEQGGKNDIKH